MPIFQHPDSRQFYQRWSENQQMNHDFHRYDPGRDQYGSNDNGLSNPSDQSSYSGRPTRLNSPSLQAQDRADLIQQIKAVETSKWSQHGSLRATGFSHRMVQGSPTPNKQSIENDTSQDQSDDNPDLASPAEIQRPRSALHTGDFREGTPQPEQQQQTPQSPIPSRRADIGGCFFSSSPSTPWFAPSFSARTQTAPLQALEASVTEANRSPTSSFGSISSSYVLKAPTSPLIHQANNTDLDFSPRTDSEAQPTHKASRRRTLPPDTFRELQAASTPYEIRRTRLGSFSGSPLHPHRPLASSYSLQLASSVHGFSPRPRRPSLSSDIPCRTHAPMVGSYEESILRGRMSTSPSKPLDFTAQIGVLGKSKGKTSLKCPPHVTVPFPAVFYSYPTSGHGRTISDDSPSPYVGMIDLENSLPKHTSSSNRRRKHHQSPAGNRSSPLTEDASQLKHTDQERIRRQEKKHRRTESPKSPPGGCYRIPEQGHLQVMIKNPNKTAVKLFLVPYDLSDMEPGTKTFIRQRSYSAGPILDMPLSARSNYGTDRPEASLSHSDDPNDKPVLRYLIHLNICCPSRGRYYLHSSIRVVFANRVPDGKEKLRNEIQHPEPRYSPYKTSREPASSRFRVEKGQRESSPRPPSCRALDERSRPHPFQPIPSIRPDIVGLDNLTPSQPPTPEPKLYSKLSRGDAGYGRYQSPSLASPEGESLLARKLRGLDVHKPSGSSENHRP
ncbi:hypothetical protein BDV18DRAFT_131837 [Aspergillus unguis]